MEAEEIYRNVILLTFPTQYELTSTLLRFQEYYESPEFKGKVFTVEEFADWYKKITRNEEFTYYTDWNGFNFPADALGPFGHFYLFDEQMPDITEKEKAVVETCERITKDRHQLFYVLGVHEEGGIEYALDHEIAHAFFCTSKVYRDKVLKVINKIPPPVWVDMVKFLKEHLYHPSVWFDEINAYGATGFPKENPLPKDVCEELNALFIAQKDTMSN